MSKKTVLLTGFEPFDDQPLNASWEAVQAVRPGRLRGVGLERACLPTAFEASTRALRAELRRHRPELVICVGQAGGRAAVTPERVAINVDDARIPDNDGAQPIDAPIVASGPPAYFSTLPIKAIVAKLRAAGLPAEVSQTAGTFVCNHVFYRLMRALRRRPGTRGGFVHVPLLPEQAVDHDAPSLPREDQGRALELIIRTSLSRAEDRRLALGATH